MILRMSSLFVRTLREDPADAEVPSHRLLVRAGYIRRAAPGIYSWLPLGLRVLRNIERIVREEMDSIGAQELQFPALLPREPYEATGRWRELVPQIKQLSRQYDLTLLAMEQPSQDAAKMEAAFQAAAELAIPIINCGPGGKANDESTFQSVVEHAL